MENLYDLIQIMNRRLGLLNKNCCSINDIELTPILSHIVYEIDKQNHPSMQEVADTLGSDITTFSRQVQKLIKLGLVKKEANENDRRVYALTLTKEGEGLLNDTKNQMEGFLGDILSHMSKEEKENVLSAFHLFNEKMAQSSACCRPIKCD